MFVLLASVALSDCDLQDSRTPALAVVIAVGVNIFSNLVAVAWLGLGLQGAAATTVATQVGRTQAHDWNGGLYRYRNLCELQPQRCCGGVVGTGTGASSSDSSNAGG